MAKARFTYAPSNGLPHHERAVLVWELLARSYAPRFEIVTYGALGKRANFNPHFAGSILNFPMRWCLLNGLPLITSIVVQLQTGKPGPGFLNTFPGMDLQQEQMAAFRFDWSVVERPSAQEMVEAVEKTTGNEEEFYNPVAAA